MFDFNALNEISEKIKADIKNNTDVNAYSLWFESMDVLKLTDLIIAVSVPTTVKKIKIESKYKNLIIDAAKNIYDLKVQVIVYSTQDGKITREQIDADERAIITRDAKSPQPNGELTLDEFIAGNNNTSIIINNSTEASRSLENYNLEYTFDNFVIGTSNRLAYKACTVVAQYPAVKYNPFFIYGPSGIGKTHLLYSIANEYAQRFKNARVLYTNGEEFTNSLINSLSEKERHQKQQYLQYFREKYRSCDMLLIDDIQFIEGKDTTQEEFFHTFNALYASGKQIIMTSDRPPKNIKTLEDRLTSRFESGLIVDIQPPDWELRIAILKRKSEDMGIKVPNDVLSYLADNISSNIRQIEGAIKKLNAYSYVNNTGITLELAKACLADILSGTEPINVTVEKVINLVSEAFAIPLEELRSKKRTKEIAFARNVAIYIIRKITDLSMPKIGKIFDRDHATIYYAINSIEEDAKINASLSGQIEEIAKQAKQAKN